MTTWGRVASIPRRRWVFSFLAPTPAAGPPPRIEGKFVSEPFRAPLDGSDLHVAVVRSRFTEEVTERLLAGALEGLHEHGVEVARIQVVEVPGSVELPVAARWIAERGQVDAIVCLGTVIRGETDHYDYVCQMAAEGILQVNLQSDIPVSFGVLTCQNRDQAMARSAPGKNRGKDAALVALEMANLRRRLSPSSNSD